MQGREEEEGEGGEGGGESIFEWAFLLRSSFFLTGSVNSVIQAELVSKVKRKPFPFFSYDQKETGIDPE